MKFKNTYILFIMFFVYIFYGCKKQKQYIPYVKVDIYININNPSYFHLTSVSGWDTIMGGSKGLIAYRVNPDEIIVYDRHCTGDNSSSCNPASVNKDNVTIDCDCDNSKYFLHDGSIYSGPANYPLYRYNNTFDGQILHIFN